MSMLVYPRVSYLTVARLDNEGWKIYRQEHSSPYIMEDPDADASMRSKWLGQHKQGVYDFSVVREYDDVVNEAKREGKEVHMARVHGICREEPPIAKGKPWKEFQMSRRATWK